MKPKIDPRDRQFLDNLHRLGGGTIQEICKNQGVTATAIRMRIARLQGLGYISREPERTGRGRPRYIYKPTEAGLRELGENYSELALILWSAIREVDDPAARSLLLKNVQNEMVARYGRSVRSEDVSSRIQELGGELKSRGFDVEVESSESGLPILRENNCPYLELASKDPGICELEQQVFEQILGTPVELACCSLDGGNCCEFHMKEPACEASPGSAC
ncbi:MAG: winged helix DNA-binding protein [Planctomycetaceae bacterium]